MVERSSISKKSNSSDVNEAYHMIRNSNEKNGISENNDGRRTTKYIRKIFRVFNKTWKPGKNEDNDDGKTGRVREIQNEFSSTFIENEKELNSSANSIDSNAVCSKSSGSNKATTTSIRSLLHKMNIQKITGIFGNASKKRQDSMNHNNNKNEIYLGKAKTFIVGQMLKKNLTNSASLLSGEERSICDIKYENTVLSESAVSVTNDSTLTAVSSSQELIWTTPNHLKALRTETEDDTNCVQNETLNLLHSACNQFVSDDFNFSDNSSNSNINTDEDISEYKNQDETSSSSTLNMDMESDSSEDICESECNSSNSKNSQNEVDSKDAGNLLDQVGVDDKLQTKIISRDFLEPIKNSRSDRLMVENNKKDFLIGDMNDFDKLQFKLDSIEDDYPSLTQLEDSSALPIIKDNFQTGVNDNSDSPNIKTECTKNKRTYSIVEDDIKCMIKELLNASKTIKETIVSSGIKEEIDPPFTYEISQNINCTVYNICKSICDELLSSITTYKIFNIPNKKNIYTSKEVANTSISNVSCIINVLLEKVFGKCFESKYDSEPGKNFVSVNYCLVNGTPMYNSKIYSVAKIFWQNNKTCGSSSRVCTSKLPLVTIRNLSLAPKIGVFKTDDKLVNRVRKSAALLLALYEEMRDYSYHSTSKLFKDLYETINLLDLSNDTAETKTYFLPASSDRFYTRGNHLLNNLKPDTESVVSPKQIVSDEKEGESQSAMSEQPGTSSSKTTSLELLSNSSSTSFSSENVDDVETSGILPNLKYTYISDEEINSTEEIKRIEKNATENSQRNANLRTMDDEFSMKLDTVDDESNSTNDEDTPQDQGKA